MTYLIDEEQLKSIVPISENVTVSSPLYQLIGATQLNVIKPLLGKELYNYLINAIDTSTLTPEDTALLELIRPVLAWYSLHDYLPFGFIRIREIGPIKQQGTNTETVDLNNITYLRTQAIGTAKRCEINLLDFLEENKEDYPLWKCPKRYTDVFHMSSKTRYSKYPRK